MRNRRWMVGARKADSKWEKSLAEGVLNRCEFQDKRFQIDYSIPHVYNPDFAAIVPGKVILIEAKGRFRESAEARKYKHVRENLPDRYELVFLFQRPQTPMPHAKKRKDGTKQTHAEWADRNGFKWYTEDTIKEIL
jgi:hypothetical protein